MRRIGCMTAREGSSFLQCRLLDRAISAPATHDHGFFDFSCGRPNGLRDLCVLPRHFIALILLLSKPVLCGCLFMTFDKEDASPWAPSPAGHCAAVTPHAARNGTASCWPRAKQGNTFHWPTIHITPEVPDLTPRLTRELLTGAHARQSRDSPFLMAGFCSAVVSFLLLTLARSHKKS